MLIYVLIEDVAPILVRGISLCSLRLSSKSEDSGSMVWKARLEVWRLDTVSVGLMQNASWETVKSTPLGPNIPPSWQLKLC